jgi:hypothetical protein
MVSARLLPSVKEELSYTSGQQSLEMEAELGATLLYASQSPSRFGKLNSGSLRKPEGKWNVTAEAMGWLEGPKAPWAIVSTLIPMLTDLFSGGKRKQVCHVKEKL